jgi:hypothetical protein
MNASKTKAVWVGNKKYSDLILCPRLCKMIQNMSVSFKDISLPSRIKNVSSAY